MRALLAALGLVLGFSATSALAQDHAAQVRTYLDNGMAVHRGIGYSRDFGAPDVVVPLRLDHPFIWPVYLTRGVTYRAYGACDDGCSDLDMEIYDAAGNLADRDTAANDTPYVQLTPAQTGRAYVRAWLYACSHEPCTVGLRLVSGGAPVPRAGEPVRESDIADRQEESNERAVHAQLDAQGVAHEQARYRQFGEDTLAQLLQDDVGHSWTLHLDGGVTHFCFRPPAISNASTLTWKSAIPTTSKSSPTSTVTPFPSSPSRRRARGTTRCVSGSGNARSCPAPLGFAATGAWPASGPATGCALDTRAFTRHVQGHG